MKLVKEIARPGKYLATDPTTGKRKETIITPQRMESWVSTFQKMRNNGLKIPAPFRHDMSIIGMTEEQKVELLKKQKEKGSLLNGGFWEELFIKDGKLQGIIDVDDSKGADGKSTADIVGRSIQEVSLAALPEYTDGLGNKYDDPILHVALVTSPVIPGQDNFQDLPENATAVAMSQFIDESLVLTAQPVTCDLDPNSQHSAYVSQAVDVLSKLGIPLPTDTNEGNILERIAVAGSALLADRKSRNSSQSVDKDGLHIVSGGLMMSTDAAKVTADSPVGKMILGQQRKKLSDRIAKGIQDGRYSAEYAETVLQPMLSGCVMSLDVAEDGQLGPTSLDPVLDALERLPQNTSLTGKTVKDGQKVVKNGGQTFSVPDNDADNAVIDDEGAKSIMDQIFKNVGHKVAAAS